MVTNQGGTETIEFGTGKTETSAPTQTVESSDGTVEFSPEAETENEEPGKETNPEENSSKGTEEGKETTAKNPPKKEEEAKTETSTPTFKVNRKAPETETKPDTAKPEDNKETYSVTDESVINYLKTKGLDVKSLDEVAKKTKLPDAVEEFKKFHEKTGRGMKAYYNANKDWKAEPKTSTLKEFYRHQNPNATDEDINTQLELLQISEEEEDELSERDLKKRKLEYNSEYNKALKFMQDLSQEFNMPAENKSTQPKPPTPEEIAKAHRPYWEQRDKSLENLNEISLSIDGLGDIVLPVTQEQKDLISKNTQTQESFFERWKDDKGQIDTDKSSLDMAWANPEIRDQLIADMLSQAHTLTMENFSKDKRNVTLGKHKTDSTSQSNGSMEVYAAKNQTESRMGQPLIPIRK